MKWTNRLKKKYWIEILIFILGIIVANLIGLEILTSHGVLNAYFFDMMSQTTIREREFGIELFLLRMKEWIVLIFLSVLLKKISVWRVCIGFLIFSFAFLITASIFNFGWKGILVAIFVIFPQWIFYIAGIWLMDKASGNLRVGQEWLNYYQDKKKKYARMLLLYFIVFVFLILGVVTEACINPDILQKIWHFI